MHAELTAAAESEFRQAVDRYEFEQVGLGREFSDEVDRSILELTRSPLIWPKLEGEVRRGLVRRFPHGIIYRIEADRIDVLGYHASRPPARLLAPSPAQSLMPATVSSCFLKPTY